MVALSELHSDYSSMMLSQLSKRSAVNRESVDLYMGDYVTGTLDIAVPPELSSKLGVVSDWPATVVNSYAERQNFHGWHDRANIGLGDVSSLTGLPLALKSAVLDSMIFGVGFVAFEPNSSGVWIAQEVPPTEGTVLWDALNQRAVAGMRTRELFDGTKQTVLFLDEGVAYVEGVGADASIVDFVPHNLGAPSIQRVRARLKSRRWYGESMITGAVRYYTVAASRTLAGMELNREFYTYPQRWLKNGTMDMFVSSDNPSQSDKVRAGFKALTGSYVTLPPPEMGEPEMELGQFSSSPPTPFIDQVRAYSQLMASATGVPVAYLGFSTENPPSADAIRAWLDRMITGCKDQQRVLSPDVRRLGWMASRLNGVDVDWSTFATQVEERWEDPASPAIASMSDAAAKLIGAGVADATSDFILDLVRMPDEQRSEARQAQRNREVVASLVEARANQSVEDEQLAAELASRRGEA